jgi:MFS family permease
MGAGIAWNSWFGDLVPKEQRGRYFSLRSRYAQVSTFAGLISAGVLLQILQPDRAVGDTGGIGFSVIFATAALARLASAALLVASPEPPFAGLTPVRQIGRFLATERGDCAWKLLLAAASLQLATYVASPYFAPFMLEELRFSYLEYMFATVCVIAGKLLVLPLWGRTIDVHGARPTYLLVILLVALVPLPWLWASNLWWVLPAQLFSGVTWSGYELSFFSFLLDSSYKRTRAYVFAAQNVLNGAAQLTGSALGAAVLSQAGRRFQVAFAVSLGLRMLVAVTAPRWLPKGVPSEGRRDLLMRLVGFRPHGGLVHRPILNAEGPEDP